MKRPTGCARVSEPAVPGPADDVSFRPPLALVFSITVTPVNDPPIAQADSLSVDKGGTATTLTGGNSTVLANDTDAENNALTAALVTSPSSGSLSLASDGTFTYNHNGGEATSDSFSYRANDGNSSSDPATVGITVVPAASKVPALSPLGYAVLVAGMGLLARRRLRRSVDRREWGDREREGTLF